MSDLHQKLFRLPPKLQGEVLSCLVKGRPVSLHSEVEVMELAARGKALIWMSRPGGGSARIGSCTLSPGQWAEAMLCMERGLRPVFMLTWHALGSTQDKLISLGAANPQMEARPAYQSEPLQQLIG